METREPATQELQGTEVRSRCDACAQDTTHLVLASAEIYSDYSEDQFWIKLWDEYMVVECRGCQAVRFRHVHRNTEDERPSGDPSGEWVLVPTVKLYPPYNESREELHQSELLPPQVRAIYEETLSALNGSLPVLAGIGLRALVETICKDLNASGKNLEERIDSLVQLGVVTSSGAEILHGLRIMGNEAAHEVKPQKAKDLHVALDVVEHTVQGAYILPRLAADLPRRRARTSGSKK